MILIDPLQYAIFLLFHATLYILYICVHKCIKRSQFHLLPGQIYHQIITLMCTSTLYYLGGSYSSLMDTTPTIYVIEFYLPCIIWVVIAVILYELKFTQMSITEIKSWDWKAYLVNGILSLVLLTLLIMNAYLPEVFWNLLISLIPCVLYYGCGFLIYLLDRHEEVQYSISYTSLFFFLCLLFKTDHLYSRLFGSFTCGFYIVFFSMEGWNSLISYENELPYSNPKETEEEASPLPQEQPTDLDKSQDEDFSLLSEDMNNLEYTTTTPSNPDLEINIPAIESTLYQN